MTAAGPDTVAAIIAEPISTANGSYVPDRKYWQTLREICDKHDIVLIADEVINGFGRTGKWFGMDHFGVQPDIMTTAKQISSGYSPIAATLVSDEIAKTFEEAGKDGTIGGITWGANPVSCAVALGNLNIIEREGLVENSARVGEHVRSRLVQLREEHRTIHHTRGIGMMHVVELKKDPLTGERLRRSRQRAGADDPVHEGRRRPRTGRYLGSVRPAADHQPRRGRRVGQPHFPLNREARIRVGSVGRTENPQAA